MRRQVVGGKSSIARRTKPREPLVETSLRKKGVPFSKEEIAYIKERRTELLEPGVTDVEIAKKISEERSTSWHSIYNVIRRLVSKKHLHTNSHASEPYSEDELTLLETRRNELIAQGLSDKKIITVLLGELSRTRNSIRLYIKKLVKKGKLQPNPNHTMPSMYSEDELTLLEKRRNELIAQDLSDKEISKVLVGELSRSEKSIYGKIIKLVRSRKFRQNPNNKSPIPFSDEEIRTIIERRVELVEKGLNDTQISEVLSNEMDRTAAVIYSKILQLSDSAEIPKNPNAMQQKPRKHFSDREIAVITEKREELIEQGLTDNGIATELAKQMDRDQVSIANKIRRLVKKGKLRKNPKSKILIRFTDEEVELIIAVANALYVQGTSTRAISTEIMLRIDREVSRPSILNRIRLLKKQGKIKEPNPDDLNQQAAQELFAAVNEL